MVALADFPNTDGVAALSAEIAALLAHYRDVRDDRLLAFAGSDPYPSIYPAIRAAVAAALQRATNHAPEISSAFAEFGAFAATRDVDHSDLMAICGRMLQCAERHIGRAHPGLVKLAEWVPHWTAVNQVACRAAIFGHRRDDFGSRESWHVALFDDSVPSIPGLPARVVVTGGADPELLRVASARVDDGGNAVITTDGSGTIVYWNDPATTLYGWKAREVIGSNIVDVTPTNQTRAEAESIMRQLIAGRVWSGQFIVRTKSGEPLRVYVTDIPVRRQADIVGVIGLSARR